VQARLAIVRDTQGNYIMQRSPSLGTPDSIQGRPITVAEDMPNIGAGALPIAVGDFSRGYLIADIPGMWMVRDEITKVGWVRFPMAKRVGGRILDSNAIKLLRVQV
jgi:HK97 family phage major capsid protein